MDETLRKLERDFQSNPTLEIAERIVNAKTRSGCLDTLMEIHESEFAINQWHIINDEHHMLNLMYLQLPHGILLKDTSALGQSLSFIPGIKIKQSPPKPPERPRLFSEWRP